MRVKAVPDTKPDNLEFSEALGLNLKDSQDTCS